MYLQSLTPKERSKEERKKSKEQGMTKNGKTRLTSYKCNGIRADNFKCRQSVSTMNGYCVHHQDQAVNRKLCKCYLQNGNQCPYLAVNNDLCQYHQEPKYCQGVTLTGDKCLKVIDSGQYCNACKSKEPVIKQSVKDAAEEIRSYLIKDGQMAIPLKKSEAIQINTIKIEIPSDLKKIPLAKPDECCICYESMMSKYIVLKCSHCFHTDCISRLNSMTCPVCRATIDTWKIPQWVKLRIEENITESKKEREAEQLQATQTVVRSLIANEVLEMDSTEEEDFNQNLIEGRPMSIQQVTDNQGNERLAIVFAGSPNN